MSVLHKNPFISDHRNQGGNVLNKIESSIATLNRNKAISLVKRVP